VGVAAPRVDVGLRVAGEEEILLVGSRETSRRQTPDLPF